ncbi:hypothetical protein HanIR_Chr07g0324831 [Helianthus annuus]|nr:hypothetical protein HanIR_Chr07g0324831 [Helianthus annuus]
MSTEKMMTVFSQPPLVRVYHTFLVCLFSCGPWSLTAKRQPRELNYAGKAVEMIWGH